MLAGARSRESFVHGLRLSGRIEKAVVPPEKINSANSSSIIDSL